MIRRSLSPLLLDARGAADAEHATPRRFATRADRSGGGRSTPHVAIARWRVPLLVATLLLLWAILVGWAARAPLIASFQPAERMRFQGSDFRVVIGAGLESGRQLAISQVGTDHMALQSVAPANGLDAGAFPVLRYRWQDFPRTLELSFVFRREGEADVHTITLPPAGRYPGYFDLSDVPDWRGRIVEVGFAEFPTAQLVPANIAFRPFALVEAEFWAPSWRGSLGALGTDWSAYRPWALMSVSALGPDAPWPHKRSPVMLLAIGLFASVVLATLVLARNRAWLAGTLCVALAGGWLALDLRWLGEFADRHALTRELYAGKPWRERAAIEPDTALVASAARVRAWLAREPADAHVIIAAQSPYDVLRLAYHLLPANVAPVGALMSDDRDDAAMQPALLVVYDDPAWTFDPARRTVSNAGLEYRGEPVLDEGTLRIFRLAASR
ncbi:MAG TPA: hypothetical protein VJ696_10730 [Rhodanobacteraceae bacterium]|nr:hypothetical protein [Rhodanobacteraceae bacterium]